MSLPIDNVLLPDGWAFKDFSTVESSQEGPALAFRYSGPSGVQEATLVLFKSRLNQGWSKLETSRRQYGIELESWVELTITYASTGTDGVIRPPGDPSYGLVSRKWSLRTAEESATLEESASVARLTNRLVTWPLRIRIAVEVYKKKLRKALEDATALPTWVQPDDAVGSTGTESALAATYADILLEREEMNISLQRYTLRKVEEVTNYSTLQANHADVGRWMDGLYLSGLEQTWEVAVLVNAAALSGLIWKKMPPQVDPSSFGNYQISQEYVGGFDPASNAKALAALVFVDDTILRG